MTLREYLRDLFTRRDRNAIYDFGHRQWDVHNLPAGVELDTVATEPTALFTVYGKSSLLEGMAGADGTVTYGLVGWDEVGAKRLEMYAWDHGIDGVTVSRVGNTEWEAYGKNLNVLLDIALHCPPSRTVRVHREHYERRNYIVSGCASMEEAKKALETFLEKGVHGLAEGVVVDHYGDGIYDTFSSDLHRTVTDIDGGRVPVPDELEVGQWLVSSVEKSEHFSDVTVDVDRHESLRDIEVRAHETARSGADGDVLRDTESYIDGKYDGPVPRYVVVDGMKHHMVSMDTMQKLVPHYEVSRSVTLPLQVGAPEHFEVTDTLMRHDVPDKLRRYVVDEGASRYRHTMPLASALQYMELSEHDERIVAAAARKLSPAGVPDDVMRALRAAVCLTDEPHHGDVTVHLERNERRIDEYIEGCPLRECAAKLEKDPSLADDDKRMRTWLADAATIRRVDIRFDTKNDRIILDFDIADGNDGVTTLRRELPLDGDSRRNLRDNWGLSVAAPSMEVKELLMKTMPEQFMSYRGDEHKAERDDAVKAFASVLAGRGREQYVLTADWHLYADDPVVGCTDKTLTDIERSGVVHDNLSRLMATGISIEECRTLHEKGYAQAKEMKKAEKKTEKKAEKKPVKKTAGMKL